MLLQAPKSSHMTTKMILHLSLIWMYITVSIRLLTTYHRSRGVWSDIFLITGGKFVWMAAYGEFLGWNCVSHLFAYALEHLLSLVLLSSPQSAFCFASVASVTSHIQVYRSTTELFKLPYLDVSLLQILQWVLLSTFSNMRFTPGTKKMPL